MTHWFFNRDGVFTVWHLLNRYLCVHQVNRSLWSVKCILHFSCSANSGMEIKVWEILSLTCNVLKFSFSFLMKWIRSSVPKRCSQHFRHASYLCQLFEFFLRLGYAELYHNLGDDIFLDMAPEMTIKIVRMNDFRFSYWVRIFLFVFISR